MPIERRTRIRFFLAFWLFILSAVAFLDRTNLSIAGLQISQEFGLGNQRLGWAFSAFLIGYAGFQLPAGWLALRFGPRKVLTFGVLWWGVTTALTALLPSHTSNALPLLLIIRFALGVGESVIYPAANQFVANWIPSRERGLVNGLIFAGVGAGSGLTPPLLTWMIAAHGWRSAFWFSAAAGVAAGLVWWLAARDTPQQHPAVSPAELNTIRAGLAEPSIANGPSQISWRAIFTRRDLAALMCAYFCFGYIAYIFFSWFFIYLAGARGVNAKSSALLTMLPFLSITIFCLAGGFLSDRLSARRGLYFARCVLASMALFATAILLVIGSRVSTPLLAVLVLALGAGTLYLAQSSYWSAAIDIAGKSSSIFSSLMNMGNQIGGAITASLTPWIAQRFGWTASFDVAAVLAVFGALCWLTVHPERQL